MKFLFVASLLLIEYAKLICGQKKECGVNPKSNVLTRIVGGTEANPHNWPWLAYLVHRKDAAFNCGGTLLSDSHVLTAAHCLVDLTKQDFMVHLGEFKNGRRTGGQILSIKTIKSHERYNTITYENDIAIIKLDRPARLTNMVYPICLPSPTETFTDRIAYVAGWGRLVENGPLSSTLQETSVKVGRNNKCAKNYKRIHKDIFDTNLCAASVNRDACSGDSGGPLNCMSQTTSRWELCGIVSFGYGCARPDYPGVYTRVTEYLTWIQNTMLDGSRRRECKSQEGKMCIFPFTYQGTTFTGCTTVDHDGPWCALETDDRGIHEDGLHDWGDCGARCEGTSHHGCCDEIYVDGTVFPSGVYTKLKSMHNGKPVYKQKFRRSEHQMEDFCVFYARHWRIDGCSFVEDDEDWSQGWGWSEIKAHCPGDIGDQWRYYSVGDDDYHFYDVYGYDSELVDSDIVVKCK